MNQQWWRRTLLFAICASATLQPTLAQAPARPAPAAQPRTPAPPPASPVASVQLLRARTAYLVNNAGAGQPFDDMSKALKRWRRWTLVERAEAADIVVSLAPTPIGSRPVSRGGKQPAAEYQLSIQSRANATAAPLWRDIDQKPARLIERLRDEIDGPPTFCFAFWCK